MNDFRLPEECTKYDPNDPANGNKQVYVQLVLSLGLGISAFFGFCVSVVARSYSQQQRTDEGRFFAQDGRAYTLHERESAVLLKLSPIFLIHFLDGYQCCTR